MRRQRGEVLVGSLHVEVEADLGELQAHLRVEPTRPDEIQHAVVVLGHAIGPLEAGQVLAQVREQDADPVRTEMLGGVERLLDRLARHETAHRSTRERQARQVAAQEGVARHPQQDPAHAAESSRGCSA
jgi:hypothetical protein